MEKRSFESAVKPAPEQNAEVTKAAGLAWLLPAALIRLSVAPIVAGSLRLVELSGDAEVTPAHARDFASPLPVILHVVSASVYSIVGAFQFSAGLHRRKPSWHRAAGKVLVLAGLIVALTALWMNQFNRSEGSGALLYLFRLLFGSAMAISITLGFTAVRRGDIVRHRAWAINLTVAEWAIHRQAARPLAATVKVAEL